MQITVGCPACGHRYDIAGKLAGKRVRCKQCAAIFRVPVPVTMPPEPDPAKKKRRKRSKASVEAISELLDGEPSVEVEPTSPASDHAPGPLIADIGDRWWYRSLPLLLPAAFLALWWIGALSALRATVLSCLGVGACLLLPILAGWASFERSRRARMIAFALGMDGARAVLATLAVALWIFALLVALDAVHIEALLPREPAAREPATSAVGTGLERRPAGS
jgi:hypothetical protein